MNRGCELFIPGPCDIDGDVLEAMSHQVQWSDRANLHHKDIVTP
jgi:aspartate aminotransferase-like enzyme